MYVCFLTAIPSPLYSQAALTVSKLYFELKNVGHPAFVKEQKIRFSLCSTTEEDADLKVSHTEKVKSLIPLCHILFIRLRN